MNGIDLLNVTIIAFWVSKFPSQTSDALYMSVLDLWHKNHWVRSYLGTEWSLPHSFWRWEVTSQTRKGYDLLKKDLKIFTEVQLIYNIMLACVLYYVKQDDLGK